MKKKTLINLADLTHRGLVLSSNVFPLSIGLISIYLLQKRPDDFEIELFKYPEDFSATVAVVDLQADKAQDIAGEILADGSTAIAVSSVDIASEDGLPPSYRRFSSRARRP